MTTDSHPSLGSASLVVDFDKPEDVAGASRGDDARRGPNVATGHVGDELVPETLKMWAGWAWRILAVAAALWVVGQVAGGLTFVLVAMFVGLVISALLLPLVDLISRALPRGLAVAVSLVASAVVVFGVLTFIATSFIAQLPELGKEVSGSVSGIRDWLKTGSPIHVNGTQIDGWLKSGQDWLTGNAGSLAGSALGGVGTVGELLTGLGLAVFAAIFFLHDGAGMWRWIVDLTPARTSERMSTSGELAWGTFSAYARGTVFIAFSNAVLVGIGLTVLRVPLPIPLALLVFFGTFIPYVGAPIAMLVAALVAFTANGPLGFILVVAMIAVIGQLEGNVLQPLIMSKQVALHPLVIILSLTAGSVTAGIVGAIVAVPIVSVLWVVTRYLTGRDPDHPKAPCLPLTPVVPTTVGPR
jgi:predicted PurR-regulated permease PerM